jgi:predicted TIM-barrel fold metal-dependent hydrolase
MKEEAILRVLQPVTGTFMNHRGQPFSRRQLIIDGGFVGVAGILSGWAGSCRISPGTSVGSSEAEIGRLVNSTLLVDTHEHLLEEEDRILGNHRRIRANDWSFLLSHYLNSDLITSGMPQADYEAFFSRETDPLEKWRLIEPYWPEVKNTGYGQAVEIAVQQIYGIQGLSAATIPALQSAYVQHVRPGFYRTMLGEIARIESCQVNSLDVPFRESSQPLLLMQDISILGMHMGPNIRAYAEPAGMRVTDLADWHSVIDWWFETYAAFAVAVKTQAAYSRNIDFSEVPPEEAEQPFRKKLAGDPLLEKEQKQLEDHLFWYCVGKATENDLPIKIHTGYYAGDNSMPLGRLQGNAGAASDLCRAAPDTRFVFMHINYPAAADLIALAKHYTNCYVDMCWAWIISPVASIRFLEEYLVTAPANKVLTFGGDYIPVEPAVGHAELARRGIAQVLSKLVEQAWMDLDSALRLVDPLMRGNARRIFRLAEKTSRLKQVPWM